MATGEGDTLASHDQSSFDNNTSAYSLDPPDLRPPPHPQHAQGHFPSQYQSYHQQGATAGHGHGGYAHAPPPPYHQQQSVQAPSHAPSRSSREGGFNVGIGMGMQHQHEGVDFGVLGNEHFDSVARDMQTELYEARIVTADKEIEALHRNLQKERNLNAQLRAQLQSASQQRDGSSSNASARDGKNSKQETASALGAPKQSAEPVLPNNSASTASQLPPAPEPPKTRMPTRRGSTGAILSSGLEKATTSNAIPTFAPTGAAAPGTATTAAAAPTAAAGSSALSASNDPIFDFTQEYVVPEVNSKLHFHLYCYVPSNLPCACLSVINLLMCALFDSFSHCFR